MNIYQLKVSVREKDAWSYKFGNFFSEVYATLDEAIEIGIREVGAMIEKARSVDPFYKDKPDKPIEDFIDSYLSYVFTVYEFDPHTEERQKVFINTEKLVPVPFIEWDYDYKGGLLMRTEWRGGLGYLRYPGDELANAGTHFKPGDLVTLSYSKEEHPQVYVVEYSPGSPIGVPFEKWENVYTVLYIREDGIFSFDYHEHFHESKLRLYTGDVPENSALNMLNGVFSGRKKISEELKEKILAGEIGLSDKPNWRSIRELAE
jgi:hypothetical protein